MVSTSIGEEGLDIGEVDLVLCYESPKTPVRTVSPVVSEYSGRARPRTSPFRRPH